MLTKIGVELNRDDAAVVCDALTEWGRCQREKARSWKVGTDAQQAHIDEAERAEAISDCVQSKLLRV